VRERPLLGHNDAKLCEVQQYVRDVHERIEVRDMFSWIFTWLNDVSQMCKR